MSQERVDKKKEKYGVSIDERIKVVDDRTSKKLQELAQELNVPIKPDKGTKDKIVQPTPKQTKPTTKKSENKPENKSENKPKDKPAKKEAGPKPSRNGKLPEKDVVNINFNITEKKLEDGFHIGIAYELAERDKPSEFLKTVRGGSLYRQERNLKEVFNEILSEVDEGKKLIIVRSDKGVITKKEVEELKTKFNNFNGKKVIFTLAPGLNERIPGITKLTGAAIKYRKDRKFEGTRKGGE